MPDSTKRRSRAREIVRLILLATWAVGGAGGLLACASTNPDGEEPPAPRAARTSGDETSPAPRRRAPAETDGADDSLIILPAGGPASLDDPVTLVEAAAAAQAQRATAGPPVATITEENRQDGDTRDRLSYVTPPPVEDAAGTPAQAPAAVAAPAGDRPEERYWRSSVRAARQRWRDAARQAAALRERAAARRGAYRATDDPVYRDGVIRLDRLDRDAAADALAEAEGEVVAAREDLRRLLQAGRRAGALPGWLREGLELEPVAPGEPDRGPGRREPSTIEPVEPQPAEAQFVEPEPVEQGSRP